MRIRKGSGICRLYWYIGQMSDAFFFTFTSYCILNREQKNSNTLKIPNSVWTAFLSCITLLAILGH